MGNSSERGSRIDGRGPRRGRSEGVDRRRFLELSGAAALGLMAGSARVPPNARPAARGRTPADDRPSQPVEPITLFLAGDVMTGRGIDQVLPYPSRPQLHEGFMKSALEYVWIAERANGSIPRPVNFSYIWGDALAVLGRVEPDVRIVNLETSVTQSEEWLAKGINYRMHPGNLPCLTAAKLDACVLANNHVLDWGRSGLEETLAELRDVKLATAGAGRDLKEAQAPAVLGVAGKGRVLVFAFCSETSGVPRDWAATRVRSGVNLLPDLSEATVAEIASRVEEAKRPGDVVVASIHWGGNWGYAIPAEHRRFAHQLIDEAGVDVIHGHSSHHAKGIEIYEQRPILYGCGDFLNDYEGISGYEGFRSDLSLMYFLSVAPSNGALARFQMTPMRIRRFRLERATGRDARWLQRMLDREGAPFGVQVTLEQDDALTLSPR